MADIKAKDIKLVEIEKLVPNPKNNNRHPVEQLERLAKIIEFQGFRDPIIVSNRSGFIVCGHARLDVAKKLGMEKVPVVYQDFDSEAQEYAHLTADNEIARWAELDYQELYENLKEIELDDVDMLGIEDFKMPEVEELNPQADENDVPEAPPEPITKRGDVWILGKHRLMCGDSTMIDDVEKLMNGEKADMVFTDPPYGVSYKSNMSKKFEEIKNDNQFLDFNAVMDSFMKKDTAAFIWTSQQVYPIWRDMFSDKYKSTIIWFKRGGGMGDLSGDFSPNYEMALYCTKGKPKFIYQRPGAVWDIGKDGGSSYVHPTQKPVALAEYGMGNFIKSGTVVMDFFLGSGSTLIACEKTNRKCYGMELDEKYCDVIINRWQQYTGKEAVLESTDETYNSLKEVADK